MKNAMEILAAGHKKKTTTTHSDTLVHIGSFGFAHGIVDDSISPQFARTMISKGTFYIPTFCVFEFLANTPRFIQHALSDFRLRPSLPESLSFRYVSPQYYDHYRNLFPNSAFVDSHLAMLRRNVAFLVANKVPIVLGTDMWAFPGYGVHLELEYMVKAGMTPMQAILSATKMGARFLGRDSTIGTIEPGKQADLAILVSDPLQDILSSRSVWKILKQGTMYDHEELIEESKK